MKSMQKIIKNKKGVSPLIATILLIAFAVALGAVVMNWGRNVEFLKEEPGMEKCANINLKVEKINNIPQVFYGGTGPDGFIKFTISNTGSHYIDQLIIWVIGEKDTNIVELKQSSIRVGYPLIKEIKHDFDRYGNVKKLKFIPKIKVDDLTVTCAKNALEEERISPLS
jgi:flagellin-like protein